MKPLKVIKVVAITQARQKIVMAQCKCGKVFYAWEQNINSGNTKSCGCSRSGGRKSMFTLSSGHSNKTYWHWLDGGK